MPSDKDIFFRAKQKETLDKYQAARRFMYELETDDWDHYFHKLEDENGNIYFQNVLKAQWYEAALLFYNAVVDLSWIACYISAEYFIYVDGKPVEVEGLTPIEEAYNALRKAEGYVQHRRRSPVRRWRTPRTTATTSSFWIPQAACRSMKC